MHELMLADQLKGEREIAYFRIFMLCLILVLVAAMALSAGGLSPSEWANLSALLVGAVYTLVEFMVIKKKGYTKALGFVSATIDISLVAVAIYWTRYAFGSSIASIVSSGAFALYFPIIIFSIRRHDAFNTLYTSIFASITYSAMLGIMMAENAFSITMYSPDKSLFIVNDLFNEATKVLGLLLTGILGRFASLNYDRLFEKALREQAEKERIRGMFGKYVSEELVTRLLTKGVSLVGERREATVMFIDIKNFTPLAEQVEPQILIEILNNFLSICIEAIGRNGGFIDKFIGDAIMIVFGAPEPDARHRQSAVACAKELCESLRTMNAWLKGLGVAWEFGYGIGINTGDIIVGNVGTEQRMEYTALGDAVNVASRLERMTRQLDKRVLLGEKSLYEGIEKFVTGPFDIAVKGKSETVRVYSLTV